MFTWSSPSNGFPIFLTKLRPASSMLSLNPPSDPESEASWAEGPRLPNRQAETLALRYIEDLSVAEIAAVSEIAEGTMKALLHQAREQLRRQLEAKGLLDHEV